MFSVLFLGVRVERRAVVADLVASRAVWRVDVRGVFGGDGVVCFCCGDGDGW
jgi:hypothetical protein